MKDFQKFLDDSLDEIVPNKYDDNIEVLIGSIIKEKRRKQKMTQSELAAKSGIQQASISKIESGNSNMTIHQLKRIVDALGLKISIRLEEKEWIIE